MDINATVEHSDITGVVVASDCQYNEPLALVVTDQGELYITDALRKISGCRLVATVECHVEMATCIGITHAN